MAVSAPASAAARAAAAPQYSPWASLSAFASQSSSAALCGAAVASVAAAQGAAPGCVLPQVDAPVAPPVEQAPVGGVVAPVASSGFNIIPLLIGLGVIAGLAALVLANKDNDSNNGNNPPISPN